MKKYINFLLFLTVFATIPAMAMQTPKKVSTRTLISSQDDIPGFINKAVEKGNYVFFDSYVFTHKKISDSFDGAKHVQGNVGRHIANKQVLDRFKQSKKPIQRFTDLHTKRVLISEKDPRIGTPGKTTVIDTSANLTYNTYHNLETAVITENDKEYFGQHFDDHQYVTRLFDKEKRSPVKTVKKIVTKTPSKRMVYNSRHYQLNGSKVDRITKLLKSNNPNRLLYLTSMNWFNNEVTRAVIAAHKDGVNTKIIVNGTALKKGKAQLDAMHNVGVQIYVFNPNNKVRHAQHSKVLLRIDGDRALFINSTANMTPQGEDEINIDSYHPENVQEVLKIKKALDAYAETKCIEYGKI